MSTPQVTAYIINEAQRRIWSQELNLGKKESCGQISNNTAKMECIEFQEIKSVIASFKSMRLAKPKRADKKAMESVMDEKFAIVFQSEFKIYGQIPVNISVFIKYAI
ncbi:signal transducer and activator of transcription-like protein [Leptotrombidium deliense]|uniref:Signal transducer and activator of transcription-like protein n=1 Tax=Leptotrombidium deliense TaxID=299467 RepID=A0A443QVW9_9ACAR|nr:signal transducer and activator of transcription-like protein [Leptotrombidium deliense]